MSLVSMSMSTSLQRELGELIAKGGIHREQAKKASRVSAGVVDDYARNVFKAHPYKYGSNPWVLSGYFDAKGGYHPPRARWRDWAGKKASVRFQTKKSGQTDFWHRSMLKFENGGVGNPSTLTHLLEFGAWNRRSGRFNRPLQLKRNAFRAKQREALWVLQRGLRLAVENATNGTKMGLVQFRKTVT